MAGLYPQIGLNMSASYDKYYQQEDLFGKPYPELMAFFKEKKERGKVLDLGCGQGRDLIPLAQMGFSVTGMDISKVGIAQMKRRAESLGLQVEALVCDIYAPLDFSPYDFILLNSMFHFLKKDLERETDLIRRILTGGKRGAQVVFCVLDQPKKQAVLRETIGEIAGLEWVSDHPFKYVFEDTESGHRSEMEYKLSVVKIGE